MKKAVFLANLAIITASVYGMQNDAFQSNDNRKNDNNQLSYANVVKKHLNKSESTKIQKNKDKQIILPNKDICSKFWRIFNSGTVKELDLLVKEYPSLINIRDEKGNTPLHIALSKYLTVTAWHLIDDLHFDINAQNYNGDTPLISWMQAYNNIRSNHLKKDFYKILIHILDIEDLDVNVINKDKTSALTMAIRFHNSNILWKLLRHGVNINTLNRKQIPESSLDILKSFEELYSIFDDLKKGCCFRAWVKVKYSNDSFIKNENNPIFRCVKLFSKATSNPLYINSTNEEGDTALTLACAFDFEKVAESILEKGANPNKPNELSDVTPLMIASKRNNLNLVKLLIKYGANINQINEQTKDSALIVASKWGRIKIVDLLLKHGADPHYKNDKHTAYDYAKLFDHKDVAELIQNQISVYNNDPTFRLENDVVKDTESVKDESDILVREDDVVEDTESAKAESDIIVNDYTYDPTFRWGDDVVEDTVSVKAESNIEDTVLVKAESNIEDTVSVKAESNIIVNDSDDQNKYKQFSKEIFQTNKQQNWADFCKYQSQLLNQLSEMTQQLKLMSNQIQKQSTEIEILKNDNLKMKQLLASKRKRFDFEEETDETNSKRSRLISTDLLNTENAENPPFVPEESLSEFKRALTTANTIKIRRLISRYPKLVVKRKHQGWTPLMKIICDNKIDKQDKYITVQAMLEANEKVNKTSNQNIKSKNSMINKQELSAGNSALNMAIIQKDSAIVKLLLQYGADPNILNYDGRTSLMYAVEKESMDIVKNLLKYKADPNKTHNKNRLNALHMAVLQRNKDIVELLLKYDADPNQKDSTGWTSLMKAVKKTHTKIAKLLLDHGAKINEQENRENTALHQAVSNQDKEMVELLLEYGADPNIQNEDGWTPLILSAEYGLPQIMKKLINHGADLYRETLKGNTALRRAMFSKKIQSEKDRNKIIEMMIEVDPRIIDYEGSRQISAFSEAKKRDLIKILQLFTNHKEKWESYIHNNNY